MRLQHTAQRKFRLQFHFVFRRIQSPQMLPPTHPCLPLALWTFSGPSIPQIALFPFRFLTPAVLTFFRPSQFWVLTTQPLFFFSFSSRFRLTVAFPVPALALASSVSSFSLAWFPVPSFQIPVLSFAVRFLSLYPVSLPQPFHRCLPCAFAFGIFHFRLAFFRPLAFRFQLLSLCSSSPTLPGSASQLLSRCPFPLSLPRFPLYLRPGFPCLPSRFLYSAFLFVSFRSCLIRFPQLFLRCLPCAFAFGLSAWL